LRSIQRRLGLGLGGALLVVGLLLAQTSLWLFESGLRRYLEDNLRDDSEALLAALVRGQNGPQLDESRVSPAFQQPLSGHYFHINVDGKTWRSRSLWDSTLPLPEKPGLMEALANGPQAQQLLVYRADYQRLGRSLSITVAQDYTPILDSFRRVRIVGLALGAGTLLLILLLHRLTVRRALRPLERARVQIAQLQDGRRGTLDSDVPDELEPLVRQINHLLEHTEQTLQRSRNALGNLGHALKTPLAVLVSLLARSEFDAHPALRQTLREQLEQIEQRLSRELGRARLAGEVLPGAQFVCARELPALFATLQMIHGQACELSWEAESQLSIQRDREDVLELLGNLLDNACKWADSKVRLQVLEARGGIVLLIDDDGPGIETSRRDDALGRGVRLDEQVSGHGLGLSIVRDIVEAWRGYIDLLDSPLGGLRVSIRLPASAGGADPS